jgi:hypothetical protein
MRANVLPLTPTPDTPAGVAGRAALAFKSWTRATEITPERWHDTARAVQVAVALLDLSKDELRNVIADDSTALDAAIDELTGHTEFLGEVADLLRRAQARLQTSHAAERFRTGSRLVPG